ncbi:hypothetical protein DM860_015121 [Cuscuta australis]|uniref:Uncharacterized protein n=1 Tax=Cuscuta australis TaxID=267555 RepID=A0A328DGB2_9ASTE|nr:hypothetical protein DM860_015121 [Cuscuta australis]
MGNRLKCEQITLILTIVRIGIESPREEPTSVALVSRELQTHQTSSSSILHFHDLQLSFLAGLHRVGSALELRPSLELGARHCWSSSLEGRHRLGSRAGSGLSSSLLCLEVGSGLGCSSLGGRRRGRCLPMLGTELPDIA